MGRNNSDFENLSNKNSYIERNFSHLGLDILEAMKKFIENEGFRNVSLGRNQDKDVFTGRSIETIAMPQNMSDRIGIHNIGHRTVYINVSCANIQHSFKRLRGI